MNEAKTEIGRNERRSRWISSLAALKHISDSYGSDEVKTRSTDRITNILFIVAMLLATIWLIFPSCSSAYGFLCDLCFGITLAFYLANRFGILTMLTPRQAVLLAELIVGFMVLGVYLTANTVALVGCIHKLLSLHQ